ncbi:hypothetical protein DUI87_29116 [Hirundo rustica rustica]|uniref:Uncharacterized protein n=1 Tax=Hirundo rustica rustica TaxID=333673 RepID=A0A3M0J0G7_HIRRU|nr:hypothetical protein DUI87_29116 [Hirundo rustica rustica]
MSRQMLTSKQLLEEAALEATLPDHFVPLLTALAVVKGFVDRGQSAASWSCPGMEPSSRRVLSRAVPEAAVWLHKPGAFLHSPKHLMAPGSHGILEWFGFDGMIKIIQFQPLCCGQGQLSLDQIAQGPVQVALNTPSNGASTTSLGNLDALERSQIVQQRTNHDKKEDNDKMVHSQTSLFWSCYREGPSIRDLKSFKFYFMRLARELERDEQGDGKDA